MFLRLCFHFGDKIFSVRLFLAHSNLKIMSKFSTIYRTKSSFLGSSLEFNMYRLYSILEELMIRNLIKKNILKMSSGNETKLFSTVEQRCQQVLSSILFQNLK